MSLNTISITGRIAKDVALRYSEQGLAVLNLTIPDNYGTGDNKKTAWFDVTFFGKQAETIAQYFQKGSNIVISGRITEAHAYLTKADNQPAAVIRVKGNSFGFVDSKQEEKVDEGF